MSTSQLASKQTGAKVAYVTSCCKNIANIALSQSKEPLIISKIAEYQFQYICADYFEIKGNHYLAVVDRFSSWIMIYHFPPTRLDYHSLIDTCQERFTTYGTPEEISSDGGPQFIAHQFQEFLHQLGVQYRLSSGEYPQSNDRAELGVKSVKHIIYDNVAPNGSLNTNAAARAVLRYHNTPLPDINLSPAQIQFHRQLCDHLPVKPCYYHLHKDWIISSKQREDYAHQQNQQTRERYDSPVTREHPALEVGTNVIIHNTRNSPRARWDKQVWL